jgi:hypothetical protein
MSRNTGIAITTVLVLVGLSALGYGGVVLTNTHVTTWGQDSYWIQISDGSPIEVAPDNASVVSYTDLPVEGQRAFDNARQGRQYTLWSECDSAAIETLNEHDYVRYRGEYFEYGVAHGHEDWGSIGAILLLTFMIGGIFTAAGVSRVRRHVSRESSNSE